MAVTHYRELIVWQKAMDLVENVYRATGVFPREEIYSLTSQMRRAAVSVPCNIAEGQGRRTTKDFVHFLSVAHGSLLELETQIAIAERLGYLDDAAKDILFSRTGEVSRMLGGLARSLNAKSTSH
jgi:four helix bundle protein